MTHKRIQSIERALAILEIVAREGGSAKLGHIAEEAQIGKTTAHNILGTLSSLGYVTRRVGDTRYHLGGRVQNLSRIVGDDESLRRQLRPVLESISRKSGASIYLAVPSGDEILYLDAVDSAPAPIANSQIGVRERLEGSAIGKVFLAFLPGLRERAFAAPSLGLSPATRREISEVERRGYALDLEDFSPGQNCVALPWRDRGEVRASIALAGASTRFPRPALEELTWMMVREMG